MIDRDKQLKLQAYLDGELSPSEARQAQDWLVNDPEAQALVAELTATHEALGGFEAEIKLPESREFYWSKIQRDIQAQAPEPAQAPASAASLLAAWRRFLIPAGAVAVLVLAGLLALPTRSLTPEVEMAVAGADTFTYRDFTAQTTLVWVSYPEKNDLAETTPLGSFE